MTREETVLLTRYVRACCPQQAIDKYTPDAWHDLLGDLELADCRAAVGTIARQQPFVAPSEIRAHIHAHPQAPGPHSQACRSRSCRECVWSWCSCTCHGQRAAIASRPAHAITRSPSTPDVAAWASKARRLLGSRRNRAIGKRKRSDYIPGPSPAGIR